MRVLVLLLTGCLAGPALASPQPALACTRHGPGFVEVPGTATCIRIGGRVSAAYGASGRRASGRDLGGVGSSARLSADVRADTAYGPVRTFVRLRVGQGGPAGR